MAAGHDFGNDANCNAADARVATIILWQSRPGIRRNCRGQTGNPHRPRRKWHDDPPEECCKDQPTGALRL